MPDQMDSLAPALLSGNPQSMPDYFDMQRKQLMAQLLLGNAQQATQVPPQWDAMRLVPRRTLLNNIATVLSGALAGRGMRQAQQAEANYYGSLMGAAPQSQGEPTQLQMAPPAAPGEVGPQPIVARNGQTLAGAVQAAQPQVNPATGMTPEQHAQMILDPKKYLEATTALQRGTPQYWDMVRAYSGNEELARQAMQAKARKEGFIEPMGGARAGTVAIDPITHKPLWAQPDIEHNIQLVPDENGGFRAIPIPGVAEARADVKGKEKAAEEANTPHYEPDPFNPGQFRIVFPNPPAAQASQTAPATSRAQKPAATPSYYPPKTGGTAADLRQQEKGAESGEEYSNQLVKNATSATEVRRSLSELRNLAKQGGVAVSNPAKLALGSYLIAAGMSPQDAGRMLNTDVGALTAASKQTGSLALDSIHDMTSRGTNFDLATFMRYNPNLNMASPEGFQRVLDFMDKRMQQEVAKQKDFHEWKTGHSPAEWASGHAAHWLEKENERISAGAYNSAVPPLHPGQTIPKGANPSLDEAMARYRKPPAPQ